MCEYEGGREVTGTRGGRESTPIKTSWDTAVTVKGQLPHAPDKKLVSRTHARPCGDRTEVNSLQKKKRKAAKGNSRPWKHNEPINVQKMLDLFRNPGKCTWKRQ